MSNFLEGVRIRVAAKPPRTILFPEVDEERIKGAIDILNKDGSVQALLSEERGDDVLTKSMERLRDGEVDGVVVGSVFTTADVLRSAFKIVGKAEGIKTVSSSFYMVLPSSEGEQVLTFSDCAVVPEPNSEQLADIGIAAADARKRIVGDEPRVAFLSFSTHGSGGDRAPVRLVRDAVALVRERKPDLFVDGEIQVDTALSPSIAARKSSDSRLKGDANVLIFPSLDAGNIAYKLVDQLVPNSKAVGPVLQGLAKPVSDLSRGATVSDIVEAAYLTALQVT